ncbi:MAG: DUF5916 domain-containing protein [Candidatus Eisenbacteria bacterium]
MSARGSMRSVSHLVWATLAAGTMGLLALPLHAQTPRGDERRVYTTCRVDGDRPLIDGRIDETAWERVPWAGDFTQHSPNEGAPPSQPTEFKILYDDEALYIAYRAWDTQPERIKRQLGRRDYFPGDWVEINIDSRGDHTTAFSFTASVSGVRGDEFVSLDGRNWDPNWDPVWESAAAVDDKGWTAEVRIPFSQLRYGGQENQVWGIQVQRRIFREEERSVWQFIAQDASGWVSHFGELRGITGIHAQRQIELMPYAVARAERFQEVAGDPFLDGHDEQVDVGLDGKIGVTGNLVLDLTINPDFGQVEADPSEVNLSAFETYFSEKRPFFIEGSNIFDNGLAEAITGGSFTRDNLFYSRRIGRAPQGDVELDDGETARLPTGTTILGAAKLSGKTSRGLSIGVLESVTAEEQAEIDGLEGSGVSESSGRRDTVEPLSNYFVGRVQQDLREGATTLGAMLTAVNRRIEDPQLDFLHSAAYVGGLDFYHAWHERTYYLIAKGFASHIRGDEQALLRTQTSSAHYYQRPDAEHVELDTMRTSLSGHAGSVRVGRTSNGPIRFESGIAWRSPGFEINDLGYLRHADEINQFTWAGYRINDPFSIFNNLAVNGNQWINYDYDGMHTSHSFNVNSNATFKNQWSVYAGLTRTPEHLSTTQLRGGPASRWPGEWEVSANFSTDHRCWVSLAPGIYTSSGDAGSHRYREGWVSLSLRPSDALRFELRPDYAWVDSDVQYVSEESFAGEARYILGNIRQETLGITFRADVCLTSDLTIQYYGQPFVSVGNYRDFRRITDPRAPRYEDRFHLLEAGGAPGSEIRFDAAEGAYIVDENRDGTDDYAFGDPDFKYKAFNSNLVVRWEYRAGSLLYLVWSQGREESIADGGFAFRDDFDELFRVHPHNIFLIKVSRWFAW